MIYFYAQRSVWKRNFNWILWHFEILLAQEFPFDLIKAQCSWLMMIQIEEQANRNALLLLVLKYID